MIDLEGLVSTVELLIFFSGESSSEILDLRPDWEDT